MHEDERESGYSSLVVQSKKTNQNEQKLIRVLCVEKKKRDTTKCFERENRNG